MLTNGNRSVKLVFEDVSTQKQRVLTGKTERRRQMVSAQGLNERKLTILHAIIKTYLETGEPVGSRTISKYTDLNLSSATIRNVGRTYPFG